LENILFEVHLPERYTQKDFIICTFRPVSLPWLNQEGLDRPECGTHWTNAKCIKHFYWILQGKRSIGRPRRWWEDNIKIGFRIIGYKELNFIEVTEVRTLDGIGPSGSINGRDVFIS
jgi:hypothetical protein